MDFLGGVQHYSEDIKHRINNLSHSSEWNTRDISLSGYIFARLRSCAEVVCYLILSPLAVLEGTVIRLKRMAPPGESDALLFILFK